MSDIADILDRAADLIAPEGAWTQKAGARVSGGTPTWVGNPDAVCWCAYSAISRVRGDDLDGGFAARRCLRKVIPTEYISVWNDAPERTQAEVVAKLREAAAKARGQS